MKRYCTNLWAQKKNVMSYHYLINNTSPDSLLDCSSKVVFTGDFETLCNTFGRHGLCVV